MATSFISSFFSVTHTLYQRVLFEPGTKALHGGGQLEKELFTSVLGWLRWLAGCEDVEPLI